MLIPLCQNECRCGPTVLSQSATGSLGDSFVPTFPPRPQASITRQTRISHASKSLHTSLGSVGRTGEKRGDFDKGGMLYRGSRTLAASSSAARYVHDGLLLYSNTVLARHVLHGAAGCSMREGNCNTAHRSTSCADVLKGYASPCPRKVQVFGILGDMDKEGFMWQINRRVCVPKYHYNN